MKGKMKMDRRHFLKTGASGIAGVTLLSGSSLKGRIIGNKKEKKIIYRELGKTGIKLPIISMGVMNADNPAVMKAAYDAGIRHFDTAWRYQNGQNEKMVGRVIKEMGIRDKILLATKVPLALGNHSSYTTEELVELRKKEGQGLEKQLKEDYLKTFDESLKRLQQDYVDILYVHSVKDPATIEWPFLLEALTQIKKEGKAKYIGVSSHRKPVEVFNKALDNNLFEIILAPFSFKLTFIKEMKEVLKKARQKGIGIVAMKTQAIYGRDKNTHHTAALKYVMQNEFIDTAIPGFTTFEHMKEDFSVAYDLEYTPEEKHFLETYWMKTKAKKLAFADTPCHGCERCLSTCPKNVDIPDLMRTFMYAAGYVNFEHARITYDSIPAAKNLQQCIGCSSCSARCVNGLKIGDNIRHLKALFT